MVTIIVSNGMSGGQYPITVDDDATIGELAGLAKEVLLIETEGNSPKIPALYFVGYDLSQPPSLIPANKLVGLFHGNRLFLGWDFSQDGSAVQEKASDES